MTLAIILAILALAFAAARAPFRYVGRGPDR